MGGGKIVATVPSTQDSGVRYLKLENCTSSLFVMTDDGNESAISSRHVALVMCQYIWLLEVILDALAKY